MKLTEMNTKQIIAVSEFFNTTEVQSWFGTFGTLLSHTTEGKNGSLNVSWKMEGEKRNEGRTSILGNPFYYMSESEERGVLEAIEQSFGNNK